MNLSLSPHRRRDILNFVFGDECLEPVSLVPSQYRHRFSGLFFQCMCHHQSCLTCPILDFKKVHACSAESDKLTEGLYYRTAVNDAFLMFIWTSYVKDVLPNLSDIDLVPSVWSIGYTDTVLIKD